MKRHWSLSELGEELRLFQQTLPASPAVLRCVRAARGRGIFVRSREPEGFCEVTLQAWPASEFSLTCTYEWPEEVPAAEAYDLDRALLLGFVEGATQVEQPPWRASIVCPIVSYRVGATNALAVRIAASMAVQSLVDRGEWIVEGTTPDDVA